MNINKFEEILSWDLGDYWYERTPLEKNRVISSLLTQQRTELKQQIIDYKFKYFKQVSNPLEEEKYESDKGY